MRLHKSLIPLRVLHKSLIPLRVSLSLRRWYLTFTNCTVTHRNPWGAHCWRSLAVNFYRQNYQNRGELVMLAMHIYVRTIIFQYSISIWFTNLLQRITIKWRRIDIKSDDKSIGRYRESDLCMNGPRTQKWHDQLGQNYKSAYESKGGGHLLILGQVGPAHCSAEPPTAPLDPGFSWTVEMTPQWRLVGIADLSNHHNRHSQAIKGALILTSLTHLKQSSLIFSQV